MSPRFDEVSVTGVPSMMIVTDMTLLRDIKNSGSSFTTVSMSALLASNVS
jgi:hypothetical protein